ncbi:hypothetical protein [Bowmanella sp. JS7-9]|uniref:Exonuclease III n=1 Tax=Pseudobowmanella zhangzhouensis TaxID=1537679 RepID=A0ABW1XHA1_9ALTE|nr:hypothetical protein [Bowmanella sp. JS7-9]TBX20819.1 hypothetical protein TK45_13645 [Bowmanella sp. JS7-9]
MKKVLAVVAMLVSASVNASEVRYVPVDESIYSNLCVVAAVQGLQAAQQQGGAEFDATIRCNGKLIADFARKIKVAAEPVLPVTYKVIAANDQPESALCVRAVKEGVGALQLPREELNNIYCNGRTLPNFARTYAK